VFLLVCFTKKLKVDGYIVKCLKNAYTNAYNCRLALFAKKLFFQSCFRVQNLKNQMNEFPLFAQAGIMYDKMYSSFFFLVNRLFEDHWKSRLRQKVNWEFFGKNNFVFISFFHAYFLVIVQYVHNFNETNRIWFFFWLNVNAFFLKCQFNFFLYCRRCAIYW